MAKVKKVKQKIHKGAKKRMRISKSGKIKRNRAFTGHLQSGKTGKRRRQLRRTCLVDSTIEKKYREGLGG